MLVLSISLEGGLLYTTPHSCHPSQLHPSLNATNSVPLSSLEKSEVSTLKGFGKDKRSIIICANYIAHSAHYYMLNVPPLLLEQYLQQQQQKERA